MTRQLLFLASSVPALLGALLWWLDLDLGLPGTLAKAWFLAVVILLGLWLASRGLRWFLWRVSRRLAFSYFLIGIVPIPLALLLALLAAYIANGYFLGHLYRDALASVQGDLRVAAHRHLEQLLNGIATPLEHPLPIAFAYYRDGAKLAGAEQAPAVWQRWWPAGTLETSGAELESLPMVAGTDGVPTLAATVRQGSYGILAIYDGDLGRELSERSGIWVELYRSDDPRNVEATKITFGHREYPLKPPPLDSTREDLKEFFHLGVEDPGLLDRPALAWVEISYRFRDLGTGVNAARYVSANLTASARAVTYNLFSRSAEVDLFVYLIFIAVAFLLFDIYVIAALMAVLMIIGLSRAVNRLSTATERVQGGDFTARVEVQRSDQIGALQSTFNQMTENLEDLVAAAAQKEILEKELSIAKELQHSLLPDMETMETLPALRFAAHFEPSRAIGGDYYDVLPMKDDRLMVAVADVSGHGLSSGLRMAMVKSALQLLVEEEDRPEEILRRLHNLLRYRLQGSPGNGAPGSRGFVTATLSVVDGVSGELVVTNAGHPPTYLLRAGEVTEILLPSTPLGALGNDYGQRRVQLEPDDVVLWLSDGLIEATDPQRQDFGYDRVRQALTGLPPDPVVVRDRLLAAVAEHTGGGTPEDDCTVLVMSYRPEGDEPDTAPEGDEPDTAPEGDEPDTAPEGDGSAASVQSDSDSPSDA